MHRLPDLIAKRAELSPDKVALETFGDGPARTYRDLNENAARAAALLGALGVQAGDRVAVLCRNRVEFFELMFACAKMGAVLAPLNWRAPAEELAPLLAMIRPAALFFGAEDAEAGAQACASLALARVGFDDPGAGGYGAGLAAHDPAPGRPWWPSGDAWYLLFTSGTTGRPKAVINTYGMALVNAVNIGGGVDLTSRDRTACFLPLFHAGGIGLHALPALFAGARLTVLPGFDAEALVDCITAGRLDLVFGVPAVYQQLARHPRFATLDLSSVRHWGCGGAPLPTVLVGQFAERGALVCNGMGMTETGPTVFLMDPESVLAKLGSVGRPQLLARARIVDAHGDEVAPGVTGEVWFAGPGVTPGYWGDEAATQAAFSPDGWLKSGDLGRRDEDGFYFIVGRSKDMFISGGENVYPAEVENVLAAHPDVGEVAIIGVPDPRWGEVGRAYVVARAGVRLQGADLDAWCRARLAAYKAPKHYVLTADLPRNALGKVLKHRLFELDL